MFRIIHKKYSLSTLFQNVPSTVLCCVIYYVFPAYGFIIRVESLYINIYIYIYNSCKVLNNVKCVTVVRNVMFSLSFNQ